MTELVTVWSSIHRIDTTKLSNIRPYPHTSSTYYLHSYPLHPPPVSFKIRRDRDDAPGEFPVSEHQKRGSDDLHGSRKIQSRRDERAPRIRRCQEVQPVYAEGVVGC